ncbi:G-protein coupled receptor Mth2-like [Nymphalis io]|uniref:G-protein coupled receptor Mth2-like n=1 Tax=Inachis io TaxID=171585 RepID=UPI002169F4FC|nr:G-protein coupled receptor Mth2-like [Nymphalis io]
MKLFLLFAIFTLIAGDPEGSFCCKPEQGILVADDTSCLDIERNKTTPIKLKCENIVSISISALNFSVTNDGLLIILVEGTEPQVDKDSFCVANETTNSSERHLVVCADEDEVIMDDKVLGYCMVVSVIFMILTACVYCMLPEMRDIQGKSIINFCISSAVGFGVLSFMKLFEYSDMNLCAARGFLVYFFLIASFFWTNAISIQILLNIRRPTTSDYGWKPFIWYALYAWGIPVILTVCMAIVNFHPGQHPKPGIGLNTCWFYTKKQQWQYMYSVMSILILTNIIIFLYISIHLCCHSFASSHIKALKYKFVMTVRLFIVMGLPWIFEMISSLLKPHIIWVVTDIFNTLQGPLIFLILVVFRRKVIKAMHKRGWLDCMSNMVERHLAVGNDEEDIVHHTDVALDERAAI